METFNNAVNQIFDLQYAKILLAVAPRDLLNDLVDKNIPLFAENLADLRVCLNSTDSSSLSNSSTEAAMGCPAVRKLVETLGKLLVTSLTHSSLKIILRG